MKVKTESHTKRKKLTENYLNILKNLFVSTVQLQKCSYTDCEGIYKLGLRDKRLF